VEVLLFSAAAGRYLAPLADLDEVLMPARLRALARAPGFLAGVLSLRGSILPVLDLAERLGVPASSASTQAGLDAGSGWRRGHRILRFSGAGIALGAIVESVGGIRTVVPSDRRPAVLSAEGTPRFLGDLWLVDGHLTQQLALAHLLSPEEHATLSSAVKGIVS
jgi:purine-binding chemotaxis protein CheW